MPRQTKTSTTALTREREPQPETATSKAAGPDLSPEWLEEINRRVDDIESGRVKCIPADEVYDLLEKKHPYLRIPRD